MRGNRIQKTKLLIVEGNHEDDFFEAYLRHLGITDIQPMPIGGKTRLSDNLEALAKQASFDEVVTLVIVRDADDDPGAALQSVQGALRRAGISAPSAAWTWQTVDNPRSSSVQIKVCILILPGATNQGALEELLMQTVARDPMYNDAVGLIRSAVKILSRDASPRRPPPAHRLGKANAHAFLSTFEEPDKDQGKAAGSGVWDFTHAALKPVETILKAM